MKWILLSVVALLFAISAPLPGMAAERGVATAVYAVPAGAVFDATSDLGLETAVRPAGSDAADWTVSSDDGAGGLFSRFDKPQHNGPCLSPCVIAHYQITGVGSLVQAILSTGGGERLRGIFLIERLRPPI